MSSSGPAGGKRPSSARWWLALLVVVVLVLAGAAVGLTTFLDSRSLDGPPSLVPPPTAAPRLPSESPGGSRQDPTVGPVRVRDAGRPLLSDAGVGPVWARSASAVFRIDLATGEVVRTPTPTLQAHSTLVAGRDWVAMKAITGPVGAIVRDGSPAADLPAALRADGWLHRGPGNAIWLMPEQPAYPDPAAGVAKLVGINGLVIRHSSITIDPNVGPPGFDDGYGGLLLTTRTGIYQVHPPTTHPEGRVRLITRGALLGLGGRHLLVWDCDSQARCGVYLVDQATGRRTALPAAGQAITAAAGGSLEEIIDSGAQLSPDGKHLALTTSDGTGTWRIHVVDLTNGRSTVLYGAATNTNPNRQLAWTSNSRWLLGLTDRHLRAFNIQTRTTRTLAITNEELEHLTGPRTPGP